VFTCETRLPYFIGNTIRGALGQSLHDNFPSIYEAVFKVEGGDSFPNPYVVSVPFPSNGVYHAGEMLWFSVTLFGSACEYAEDISTAARSMCSGKLENAKLYTVDCEYSRVWSDSHADTIPQCETVTLKFLTPTEFTSSKQPVFEPDFPFFVDSLFGRISTIIDHYGEKEFIIPYSLIARKPLINAEYDLKPVQINSNNHPINGFTGKIRYTGNFTRYMPYIDLGSQLHLGKKTTRSCGEYFFEF
jgi:CRISPR-associated endoribonuclease Cas6